MNNGNTGRRRKVVFGSGGAITLLLLIWASCNSAVSGPRLNIPYLANREVQEEGRLRGYGDNHDALYSIMSFNESFDKSLLSLDSELERIGYIQETVEEQTLTGKRSVIWKHPNGNAVYLVGAEKNFRLRTDPDNEDIDLRIDHRWSTIFLFQRP